VPPGGVREGQVVIGTITEEEKHCLDLRFSTRIIACVDIVLSILNVIWGSYWTLIMVGAAICGLIGAQIFNGCLVVTYAAVSWAWVLATILNIIIITVLYFGRYGRVYSHHSWSVGLYIAFMIYFIFYLCVRIWISLIVTKLYSLLMKIGEQKAKELDDHNSYVAKCACAP